MNAPVSFIVCLANETLKRCSDALDTSLSENDRISDDDVSKTKKMKSEETNDDQNFKEVTIKKDKVTDLEIEDKGKFDNLNLRNKKKLSFFKLIKAKKNCRQRKKYCQPWPSW